LFYVSYKVELALFRVIELIYVNILKVKLLICIKYENSYVSFKDYLKSE